MATSGFTFGQTGTGTTTGTGLGGGYVLQLLLYVEYVDILEKSSTLMNVFEVLKDVLKVL